MAMHVLASLRASWRPGGRALAVLLLCAVAALAQAQSIDDGDDNNAPPDRVARLSWITGNVGLLPAGSQDWAGADLNRPLTTGDRLSTGDGARAELELGGASLRMDGDTDFGMLNLDDNFAQVELTQGTLNLSVRSLDQGQSYEIDTPTLALVVSQPGSYRVDVDNGGNGTRVTVFNGQATVYGENNAQHDVFAGRSYQFDDASLAALRVTDIGGGDAFDHWCNERDQRYAQAGGSQQYVSAEVIGYQDLDQYGSWQDSPDYGAVWYPSQVPVGWAPYRTGHWAYIAPWGWSWVDDLPWGFAPYHYGRWAWIRGNWGWIPGPRWDHPVYAPAMVGFVGIGGRGLSAGLRGGAPVGWFPLGPGEVYNPWYRCHRACYQRVNLANIHERNAGYRNTVIRNINSQYNFYRQGRAPRGIAYANRGAPHGFTAVPGSAFADGRRVQRDLLRVDPRRLAAAPVTTAGIIALRPVPRGMAHRPGPPMGPLPSAGFRRDVVARTPPSVMRPLAHANFATTDNRTPRRAAAPFGNVRVPDRRAAPPRPTAATPTQPRPATDPPLPAGLQNMRRLAPVPTRPPTTAAGLPSARYAHPRNGTLPVVEPIRRVAPATMQPQPGVSYIAGPQPPRAQPNDQGAHPTGTLPQVPRFERSRQYRQARNPQPVQPLRPAYYPPRQNGRYNPAYENPAYEPMQRGYGQPSNHPSPRFQQTLRPIPPPRSQPQPREEPSGRAPPPGHYDRQH